MIIETERSGWTRRFFIVALALAAVGMFMFGYAPGRNRRIKLERELLVVDKRVQKLEREAYHLRSKTTAIEEGNPDVLDEMIRETLREKRVGESLIIK